MTMAEMAASPAAFGCVLRDRNQQDVFEKNLNLNLKVFAKDHIRNPISSDDENSQNQIASWIENQHKNHRYRTSKNLRSENGDCVWNATRGSNNSANEKKSENSWRNENLGASSLVQIWEARLNRSNGGSATSQSRSTVSSSRSSSRTSPSETPIDVVLSRESDDSEDEKEYLTKDNAAEKASKSGKRGSVFESGESKWVGVADIIRRFCSDQKQANIKKKGLNQLLCARNRRPSADENETAEQRCFPKVTCCPRIRGQQALSDLLMRMQRDRLQELDSLLQLHLVSKFSKRGRLQSMLRLRCLQRCIAIQDCHRSQVKACDLNRPSSGSAVMHLRKKFRTCAGNSVAEQAYSMSSEALCKETKSSSIVSNLNEDSMLLEASATSQLSSCQLEEAASGTSKSLEGTARASDLETSCLCSQETQETTVSYDGGEDGRNESDTETSCAWFQEAGEANDLQDIGRNESKTEEEQQPDLDLQETSETTSPLNNTYEKERVEDEDANNQWDQYLEYDYEQEQYHDWFSEISRPQSYWEDLRKSRYLEVLNVRSEKEEICQLLDRRAVSNFLESDMREKIDRLMMFRAHRQVERESSQGGEHLDANAQGRINSWTMSHLQRDVQPKEEEANNEVEEQQEREPEEQEQDHGDHSSHSSSQMYSPSPGRSWSYRDQEISYVPTSHPSAEMELIRDLRGQIEQLQHEMLQLKSSIKSCIDMNLHLQQSVTRDNPLRQKCCVCNKASVDSLLYRCGHMCSCLKCAHELQWGSGKCPICRAEIQDVVRVFVDNKITR